MENLNIVPYKHIKTARKSRKSMKKDLIYILIIGDILIWQFFGLTAWRFYNEVVPEVETVNFTPKTHQEAPSVAKKGQTEVISKTFRTVTAYNVGDPAQTDGSPCIGAYSKVNLCELVEQGRKIVAANFVSFGTKLKINGEVYEVMDRMHSRFPNRVDIAMKLSEHSRAVAFGTQTHEVEILK